MSPIGRSWQDLAQTKVEFVPVPPWTEAYYFVVNKIQEYSWICRPESSVKMLSRAPYIVDDIVGLKNQYFQKMSFLVKISK